MLLLFLFGSLIYYLFIGAIGIFSGMCILISGLFSKDKDKRKDSLLILFTILLVLIALIIIIFISTVFRIEISAEGVIDLIILIFFIYLVCHSFV